MHSGDDLPLIDHTDSVANAVKTMSEKGFGCVGICKDKRLIGIITDGDIRRHLTGDCNIARKSVSDIMTPQPKTTTADETAAAALRRMTDGKVQIMQLFVTGGEAPIGIVHMHDFLKAGLT
jgi:arabinose-5-phosphate isomerase